MRIYTTLEVKARHRQQTPPPYTPGAGLVVDEEDGEAHEVEHAHPVHDPPHAGVRPDDDRVPALFSSFWGDGRGSSPWGQPASQPAVHPTTNHTYPHTHT